MPKIVNKILDQTIEEVVGEDDITALAFADICKGVLEKLPMAKKRKNIQRIRDRFKRCVQLAWRRHATENQEADSISPPDEHLMSPKSTAESAVDEKTCFYLGIHTAYEHNNCHQLSNGDSGREHHKHDAECENSISDASTTRTHTATVTAKEMTGICESCQKLEADVQKYRSEINHMKQIENELRQKIDENFTNESSLLAKHHECDELDERINEMYNARHADLLQMQTLERRLNAERRQKHKLEALLNNEKKARKAAEEKVNQPESSAQCSKIRKLQMNEEIVDEVAEM